MIKRARFFPIIIILDNKSANMVTNRRQQQKNLSLSLCVCACVRVEFRYFIFAIRAFFSLSLFERVNKDNACSFDDWIWIFRCWYFSTLVCTLIITLTIAIVERGHEVFDLFEFRCVCFWRLQEHRPLHTCSIKKREATHLSHVLLFATCQHTNTANLQVCWAMLTKKNHMTNYTSI